MEICFPLPNGQTFCIIIPIYIIPVEFPPHPDPGPYAGLFQDATILAAVNQAAKKITDETVRRSLLNGIAESAKGMQAKVGKDVSVKLG